MARKNNDPIQAQLIAARRSQILDAAARVFAEKGFHRATIRDISNEAGIADGTIYNYFENKTALLLGLLHRLNESDARQHHFDQALVQNSDVDRFLRSYLRQRFEVFFHTGSDVFRATLSEILTNVELREVFRSQILEPTFAIAEQHLQEWADRGLIRMRDVRLSLRVIAGMTLGTIMLRLMGDPELEARWNDVPDLIADMLLAGIEPIRGDSDDQHES